MFIIETKNENFHVDTNGMIGRPKLGWKPSSKWQALGLVRHAKDGIDFIAFADWDAWLPTIQEHLENSKPRYHLCDLDHGTRRQWGEAITGIRAINR